MAKRAEAPQRKVGRPKGKRSDPAYTQVTAWIRRETYKRVKIRLLGQENEGEFSELVETLLGEWLQRGRNDA